MIFSAQSIFNCRRNNPPIIDPFYERTVENGMTYGLGPAGYDIRLANAAYLGPKGFQLGHSMEKFAIPDNIVGMVMDKSSWARRGLSLFNTILEPGWRGFLTLEMVNHSNAALVIPPGSPIAQIIFMELDHPTLFPYSGKYQDQPAAPVASIYENAEGDNS